MTTKRQVFFWLGALGFFIFSLWLLQEILLPFIAGFVLAYFLDPVADRIEKLGFSRSFATSSILLLAILTLVLAVLLVLPVLSEQALKLAADLPGLVQSLAAKIDSFAPKTLKDFLAKSGTNATGSLGDIAGKATSWLATVLSSIWSGGTALVNVMSLLVVTPIVSFYLLLDWDRIVAKVDGWLPRDYVETVRSIAREINTAMAGFIRGQGTVCLLLGLFYAIGLSLAGLKFGLAIGFGAGLLSFIPYVGAIFGGVVAIGVGLVQFFPDDLTSVALVVGIFVIGQFVEGNFLSPKLVGGSIGLHPVWLMFALFAFGYLFGFVGLLLAVPMAAACGVLVRFALRQYLGSKLYHGRTVMLPDADQGGPEQPPEQSREQPAS
jgi:predicted PurR-regulated permease PerM